MPEPDHTGVTRLEFSTTDPDCAERCLRDNYVDARITIPTGQPLTFGHSVTGAHGFAVNRMRIGVDLVTDAFSALDDAFVVVRPVAGRVAYLDSDYPDVHADTGDVALLPPVGGLRAVSAPIDELLVPLDRHRVAAHAAATVGIEAGDLAFHDVVPLDAAVERGWTDTVVHVRDTVLGNPWAAGQPILLDQAFRSLAAALLSTFPNTALDRIGDPAVRAGPAEVPATTLRTVVEFLDTHADRPIGPETLAAVAGRPARDVVDGLRRRHGRHPAELLRQARLRGVRRELLDADPGSGVTVDQLAARWGFGHPRRFRLAYTMAFDERPEDTLRR